MSTGYRFSVSDRVCCFISCVRTRTQIRFTRLRTISVSKLSLFIHVGKQTHCCCDLGLNNLVSGVWKTARSYRRFGGAATFRFYPEGAR